jgi:hypothetical protein
MDSVAIDNESGAVQLNLNSKELADFMTKYACPQIIQNVKDVVINYAQRFQTKMDATDDVPPSAPILPQTRPKPAKTTCTICNNGVAYSKSGLTRHVTAKHSTV